MKLITCGHEKGSDETIGFHKDIVRSRVDALAGHPLLVVPQAKARRTVRLQLP